MAPKPPHVAASEGPISIHKPKHEATNEAVNDLLPSDLSATIYELIEVFPFEKNIPITVKIILINSIVNIVEFLPK